MKNQSKQRLKYVVTAAITAATLLICSAFFGKSCLHEKIQNAPEKGKKVLTAEKENIKKKTMSDFAKIANGWTLIEDKNIEVIEGVEIIDDKEGNVKKIIAEFPYDEMLCEKVSKEETIKRRNLEFQNLMKTTGKSSFALELDDGFGFSDPAMDRIEKLGKEGEVDQLLSVLKYYDSLGVMWKARINPGTEFIMPRLMGEDEKITFKDGFDTTWSAFIDYTMWNFNALRENTDVYDLTCVSKHMKLMFRIGEVISQLSKIWIKDKKDPDSLMEMLPEVYQSQFGTFFLNELINTEDFSVQYFEDIAFNFPGMTVGGIVDRICLDIENPVISKRVEEIMNYTKNRELKKALEKVLKEYEREKKVQKERQEELRKQLEEWEEEGPEEPGAEAEEPDFEEGEGE